MGDWYVDNNGRWAYDENAPSPGVEVTQIRPVPREAPPATPRNGFMSPDGSAYERVEASWFDSYDEVDSTTIVDDGGPPDAA
jgi:hypothetical protein